MTARDGDLRRRPLAATRVYLVVTESACRGPWLEATRRALASGAIGAVQLREKEAEGIDDDAFLGRAAALRALCMDAGALLILNDRVHLVAAARADGAHVGEGDMEPKAARAVLGPDLLLGVSTHDAAEVEAAPRAGADYAGLGPCFPTSTKRLSREPAGPDLVRACVGRATIPVFPIGGITPVNAVLLAAADAARVAVSAGILSAEDPGAAALSILRALTGAP